MNFDVGHQKMSNTVLSHPLGKRGKEGNKYLSVLEKRALFLTERGERGTMNRA